MRRLSPTEIFSSSGNCLTGKFLRHTVPAMQTLRQIIRAKRKRQTALAKMCGVSEPVMSRWANRQSPIPARAIRPLATELGVSVEDILAVAEPGDGA